MATLRLIVKLKFNFVSPYWQDGANLLRPSWLNWTCNGDADNHGLCPAVISAEAGILEADSDTPDPKEMISTTTATEKNQKQF